MYFSEYSKIIITFLFGTQLTYFSLKNLENIEKNIHNVYICSHGQVVIERGFSINKDVTKSHLFFFSFFHAEDVNNYTRIHNSIHTNMDLCHKQTKYSKYSIHKNMD